MSRIQAPAAVETHSIPPFFGSDSQILILGSFPSVKSRESGFTTGIRKTAFGACFPPCSTRRCRKRLIKSGSFCALIISRFGCRRRMQHTRFGGQQYFGRHRKRYCSAPPFDAIKAVFLNGQTAQKLFANIFPKKPQNSAAPSRRCLQQAPQNASYSLEKTCCRWGSAIRTVLMI